MGESLGEASEDDDTMVYTAVSPLNAPVQNQRALAAAAGRQLLAETLRMTTKSEQEAPRESAAQLDDWLGVVERKRDGADGINTVAQHDQRWVFFAAAILEHDLKRGVDEVQRKEQCWTFFAATFLKQELRKQLNELYEQRLRQKVQHEKSWRCIAAALLEQDLRSDVKELQKRQRRWPFIAATLLEHELRRGVEELRKQNQLNGAIEADARRRDRCFEPARDGEMQAEEVEGSCAFSGDGAQEEASDATQAMQTASLREAEEQWEKVDRFLKFKGYAGVNAKRRAGLKSKYPLHSAVKENNPELVALLLNSGADRSLKNSNGCTPLQLAQKSNRGGTHARVIACLV